MERRISDFLDFEQIYSTGDVETPNFRPKPVVSHRKSLDRTQHTESSASAGTPLQTKVVSSSTNPSQTMVKRKVGASILARRTKKPLSLVFA